MDVAAVRAGLATNAATITGLRSRKYLSDAVEPPVLVVGEVTINYDLAMGRGLDEFQVKCRLLVSRASDRAGQDKLDGYLSAVGPLSIKAALQSDPTLGGACADLHVTRVDGYGIYSVAGTDYLGAEINVRVIG